MQNAPFTPREAPKAKRKGLAALVKRAWADIMIRLTLLLVAIGLGLFFLALLLSLVITHWDLGFGWAVLILLLLLVSVLSGSLGLVLMAVWSLRHLSRGLELAFQAAKRRLLPDRGNDPTGVTKLPIGLRVGWGSVGAVGVVMFLLLFGMIAAVAETMAEERQRSTIMDYSAWLSPEVPDEPYVILLPAVETDAGPLEPEDASVQIVESERGTAYRVQATGNITVRASAELLVKDHGSFPFRLTMESAYTETDHNVSVQLEYSVTGWDRGVDSDLTTHGAPGWNNLTLNEEPWHIDVLDFGVFAPLMVLGVPLLLSAPVFAGLLVLMITLTRSHRKRQTTTWNMDPRNRQRPKG